MSDTIQAEFPFEEIRDDGTPEGDYFHRPNQLRALGYADSQIWSVIEGDEITQEDGRRLNFITYGPSGHYVNVIGYMATTEHHDGETYYEDSFLMEPYPEDFDDDPS